MNYKFRHFPHRRGSNQEGGATVAWLKGGNELSVGISVCSWRDTFCKKIGREIAVSRVIQFDKTCVLTLPLVNRAHHYFDKAYYFALGLFAHYGIKEFTVRYEK